MTANSLKRPHSSLSSYTVGAAPPVRDPTPTRLSPPTAPASVVSGASSASPKLPVASSSSSAPPAHLTSALVTHGSVTAGLGGLSSSSSSSQEDVKPSLSGSVSAPSTLRTSTAIALEPTFLPTNTPPAPTHQMSAPPPHTLRPSSQVHNSLPPYQPFGGSSTSAPPHGVGGGWTSKPPTSIFGPSTGPAVLTRVPHHPSELLKERERMETQGAVIGLPIGDRRPSFAGITERRRSVTPGPLASQPTEVEPVHKPSNLERILDALGERSVAGPSANRAVLPTSTSAPSRLTPYQPHSHTSTTASLQTLFPTAAGSSTTPLGFQQQASNNSRSVEVRLSALEAYSTSGASNDNRIAVLETAFAELKRSHDRQEKVIEQLLYQAQLQNKELESRPSRDSPLASDNRLVPEANRRKEQESQSQQHPQEQQQSQRQQQQQYQQHLLFQPPQTHPTHSAFAHPPPHQLPSSSLNPASKEPTGRQPIQSTGVPPATTLSGSIPFQLPPSTTPLPSALSALPPAPFRPQVFANAQNSTSHRYGTFSNHKLSLQPFQPQHIGHHHAAQQHFPQSSHGKSTIPILSTSPSMPPSAPPLFDPTNNKRRGSLQSPLPSTPPKAVGEKSQSSLDVDGQSSSHKKRRTKSWEGDNGARAEHSASPRPAQSNIPSAILRSPSTTLDQQPPTWATMNSGASPKLTEATRMEELSPQESDISPQLAFGKETPPAPTAKDRRRAANESESPTGNQSEEEDAALVLAGLQSGYSRGGGGGVVPAE